MDLYKIWENIDNSTFYIELENKKFYKKDIDEFILKLKNNLLSVADWTDKKVYLDIKDRKLFIISFLTLLIIRSKIVLVPTEVKTEDYVYKGGLFLSDNKYLKEGIFLQEDLFIKPGEDFNILNLDPPIKDNTVIYLYTSGSTGKAKLIPKTSENLITEVKELREILSITKDDLFYFTPPLYHIYGFLNGFLLPMYSSSKIILDPNFTPDSIADLVQKRKITHFVCIPTYYRMFVDLNLIDNFKSCKKLLNSSAPLPIDVSDKFYEKKLEITEIYGSTETGGIAHRVSSISLEWKLFSYVNIIVNSDEYLKSDIDQPNIVEFKIVSPAISVEYDAQSGFNTGDVVELSSEGKFILLGRNTRFVKISGKRVDLHYVQQKVSDCLKSFIGREIKEEELYIGMKDEKIYVMFEDDFVKPISEIKKDLKKHLPSYAVPRLFISSPIPRNNMGKINKVKIEEIISKK